MTHEGKRLAPQPTQIAAVIVAAGRGERAGSAAEGPKQYRLAGGRPVIAHVLERFATESRISRIVAVIHGDDTGLFAEATHGLDLSRVTVVTGGADRQASVRNGLEALANEPPGQVLIHDGARPFCDDALLDRVIAALGDGHGVIPALPVSDTLKRGQDGTITGTVERAGLFGAQTPQAFPFAAILDAHRRAALETAVAFTDDASIAEWAM